MQFIPLVAMANGQRILTNSSLTVNTMDINGNTKAWVYYNSTAAMGGLFPFYPTSTTTYESPAGTNALFAAASSDKVIPHDTYTVSNKVGTAAVQRTPTNKGVNYTVTVTGTEGDQINSIFFGTRTYYKSGDYAAFLLYAIKLDNTVTIDSTGTANFIFSIEFD